MDENIGVNETPQGAENEQQEGQEKAPVFDYDAPEFQRYIQSAVDRATNKLGRDNKSLKEQLAALQKAKMSEAELKDAELKQREMDVAEREQELKAAKNKTHALSKIKDAGLDDGTNTAFDLAELVMADDEETIDKRVASLSGFVKKLVAAEVQKTFAAHGRNPEKSGGGAPAEKPGRQAAREFGKKAAAKLAAAQKIRDMYTGGGK